MELLSFGKEVKVLEPLWLANKVVDEHRKAVDVY
jgi:predicted DNA-binding transcriptional regulator YafY